MEIDHKDEPSNKLRNLFRFFLWHIKRSRQLFFSVRDCYSYYSWGAAAASAAVLVRLLPAANSIAIISQRVKTWWESLTGCVYTRITFLTTSWAWHGRQNLLFLLAVWLLFLSSSSSIFSLKGQDLLYYYLEMLFHVPRPSKSNNNNNNNSNRWI